MLLERFENSLRIENQFETGSSLQKVHTRGAKIIYTIDSLGKMNDVPLRTEESATCQVPCNQCSGIDVQLKF